MAKTKNSRLTFGKHRGKKLGDLPDAYLKWLHANCWDTDFHEWALAAGEILAERKKDPLNNTGDLEAQADQLLKDAGYGHLTKKTRRR